MEVNYLDIILMAILMIALCTISFCVGKLVELKKSIRFLKDFREGLRESLNVYNNGDK